MKRSAGCAGVFAVVFMLMTSLASGLPLSKTKQLNLTGKIAWSRYHNWVIQSRKRVLGEVLVYLIPMWGMSTVGVPSDDVVRGAAELTLLTTAAVRGIWLTGRLKQRERALADEE